MTIFVNNNIILYHIEFRKENNVQIWHPVANNLIQKPIR